MIAADEYARRLQRARAEMDAGGIDVLALSASSDLLYLSGYEAMPLERLTLLVVGAGSDRARLLVPELEAARVDGDAGTFDIVTWSDGEDMLDAAMSQIEAVSDTPVRSGSARVAVADRMWAGAVLGLQARAPDARFEAGSHLVSRLRVRKSAAELDLLRESAAAVDRTVTSLAGIAWAGRSEADVAGEIAASLVDAGHDRVNFTIVASGPNAASPHHTAAARTMRAGDTVVVDIGGTRERYCSDTTRVVCLGEPDARVSKAYSALRAAQEQASATVKPGVKACEIDSVARSALGRAGYGEYFIHRTGHGIGLDEHEDPYIVEGNDEELAEGMCFSIEPGIYIPDTFGLRLEDIVAVTSDGVEILNRTSHDLLVVG